MKLKLLIAYNLLIVLMIGISSVKTANSLGGFTLPLLLIPLIYHLCLELVRRPMHRFQKNQTIVTQLVKQTVPLSGKVVSGPAGISDRDRRLFLKLIGSTGLSLFFMSMVSKEAQATFFGSMPGPGTISLKDASGNKINPAEKHPTDGYSIAHIDDTSDPNYAYYGFTNKDGAWYIQRETLTGVNTGAYLYYAGGSDFTTGWSGKGGLGYDDFEDIFD